MLLLLLNITFWTLINDRFKVFRSGQNFCKSVREQRRLIGERSFLAGVKDSAQSLRHS